MKKWMLALFLSLVTAITGCGVNAADNVTHSPVEEQKETEPLTMKISVTAEDGVCVIYALNNSAAAKAFYDQLPLVVKVEDYNGEERIFYPEKLDINNTPKANPKAGTLAYYAPWGDVAMFYRDGKPSSGLYELGTVVAGEESIDSLSGTITVEVAHN